MQSQPQSGNSQGDDDASRSLASAELRKRAEGVADSAPSVDSAGSPEGNTESILHDLRVHQIELEMQNEELRRTQATLDVSRTRYFDLYELAPVGYVSLDVDGMIVEANLTAASLFGVTKDALIQSPFSRFVVADHGDLFHKFRLRRMADRDPGPYSCDLRLRVKGEGTIWAQLEATNAQDASGSPVLRIAITDISARVAAESALEKDAEELRNSREQLKELLSQRELDLATIKGTLDSLVEVVGQLVETRDPQTAGHQHRVSELAAAIADEMRLPESTVGLVRTAGLIHDVGKMAVPTEILNKPGPLSPLEFELVKSHPDAGFSVVDSAHLQNPIAQIIRQHHERCDGSGYPRGLHGYELLLESKILMVADVVEAMVSHRPYRAELGLEAALGEIRDGAGRLYDPEAAAACIRVMEDHFVFPAADTPDRPADTPR